jgi:hypothetical protein
MGQPLSGPGVGLPLPQNLYPSELTNTPYDLGNNYVSLAAGDVLTIPAGNWYYYLDGNTVIQYLDPVMNSWRNWAADRAGVTFVKSDGYTVRLANLTGCPVSAVISGAGTGFAQSTATVSASVGGSTWQPIVGGQLSIVSIATAGKNYTVPPLVFIPAPPSASSNNVGGIQATGYAVISGGSVTAVSLTNPGAGYTSLPVVTLLPNPVEPNIGSISQASVSIGFTNTTGITGVYCTNNGAPLATLSALTLTAAGGSGSGATITPNIMQVVTSVSVVAGGSLQGNATNPADIQSVGGIPVSVSAIGNNIIELGNFRPRQFRGAGVCNAGGTITSVSVIDGGLFVGTPTPAISSAYSGGAAAPTLASLAFTMGSAPATVLIQPAP